MLNFPHLLEDLLWKKRPCWLEARGQKYRLIDKKLRSRNFLAASYKEHHVHLHHQHLHQDSNKSEEDVSSSRENRDQR